MRCQVGQVIIERGRKHDPAIAWRIAGVARSKSRGGGVGEGKEE